jgi:hypothetical protein
VRLKVPEAAEKLDDGVEGLIDQGVIEALFFTLRSPDCCLEDGVHLTRNTFLAKSIPGVFIHFRTLPRNSL